MSDEELIEELRDMGEHPSRADLPMGRTLRDAADRIEALEAEVERLKDQLSVETEPSPYCPICGSCGDEGCCGSKRCMYPDTGIEALRLAVVHYDAALKISWPYGASGDAWEHWNEARITLHEAGQWPTTLNAKTQSANTPVAAHAPSSSGGKRWTS